MDDFSDGDFTTNPTWIGNTSVFQITPTNELQLNNTIASTSYLSTSSSAIDNAQWDATVTLDFNPSSSNNGRIYIVSNKSDLSSSLNGYYVSLGESNDEISFYRQDASGSTTLLINGRDNTIVNSSNNTFKIRVTRDNMGNWQLFTDTSSSLNNFISEGTANDNLYTTTTNFGIYCKYTITRADKFFFDDFNVTGTTPIDNTPPSINSITVLSMNEIEIEFDEAVDTNTSKVISNYTVDNGIGSPVSTSTVPNNLALIRLTFSSNFGNGVTNTLTAHNINDIAGNTLVLGGDDFMYINGDSAHRREVVINEFMPDPNPVVNLPNAEFIEIHNPTSKVFDLYNWSISDGSSIGIINIHYALLPGEYAILISDNNLLDFLLVNNKIGISSFPSLTNSGDKIILSDENGTIVDELEYTTEWYNDDSRNGGGYSIEQINPLYPCTSLINWRASTSNDGGTPSAQNANFDNAPDTKAPSIQSIYALSNSLIEVNFDEPIDTLSLAVSDIMIPNFVVSNLVWTNSGSQLTVNLNPSIDTNILYDLSIQNLSDCQGNLANSNGTFVLAGDPNLGDVVINEILFDPRGSGSDFIELYNKSNTYIDLKGWQLANLDDDTIANFKTITENFILSPNTYVCISKDSNNIKSEYPSHIDGRFIEIPSLPTYSNTDGNAYILQANGQVSDSLSYDDNDHFPLISNPDGISLERIDYNRPSTDKTNWSSAAERVNWATPGMQNSQFLNTSVPNNSNNISVSPEIFSPDSDGRDDVLNINYNFNQGQYIANVSIYDAKGRLVKDLINNEFLSPTGAFTWDGTKNDGSKANIGIYVILFEAFTTNNDGDTKTFKKTCILGRRFE